MGKKSDKYKKKILKAEDVALWKEMTKDITPWSDTPYVACDGDSDVEDEKEDQSAPIEQSVRAPKAEQAASDPRQPQGQEVDRRTAQRLQRGRFPIDARLDLHGFSQAQAYESLRSFIRQSHARGCRCVLVITGKGRTGKKAAESVWLGHDHQRPQGVLRREVPCWLAEDDLQPFILKVQNAQPKDGGDGAFYVLLRRQR